MATKAVVSDFVAREFPQTECVVREVGNRGAVVADAALCVAILGEIGIVPLAVTTSLMIAIPPRVAG